MRSSNISAVGTARRGGARPLAPVLGVLLAVVCCSLLLWYVVISDTTVRPGFGTNDQFFSSATNRTSAVCAYFDGVTVLGAPEPTHADDGPPGVSSIPPAGITNAPVVYFQIQAFGWGNPRSTHLFEDYIFMPEAEYSAGYRSHHYQLFHMSPEERSRLPPTSPLIPFLDGLEATRWQSGGTNFGLIDGRRSLLPTTALPYDAEGEDQHHTLNPYARALHEGLLESYDTYGPGTPLAHLCQAWQSAKSTEIGEASVSVAHISDSMVLTVAGIGNVAVFILRPGGVGIAWEMPEQWHNQFVPYTLGKNGDGLDAAEVFSAQLRVGDIVVMATDGVTDNLDNGGIADVILTNKLQGPKVQQVVQVAELLGLGLAATPFSRKAMQAGLLIQGGRQDDGSALIMSVGSVQDLFARRAAMQAQSEAEALTLELQAEGRTGQFLQHNALQQEVKQPRSPPTLEEALQKAQQMRAGREGAKGPAGALQQAS